MMDGTDSYRLDCIRDFVIGNLDASHVVDHLIEKEVIEPCHDDDIRAEKTAKRRTEVLLVILLDGHRPRDTLKHFREALQKDHAFIVKKLDAVEVPDHGRAPPSAPGSGGLRTAAAAVRSAAGATAVTGVATNTGTTRTTTNRSNAICTTTNIRGNKNFVIIGGTGTTINYH